VPIHFSAPRYSHLLEEARAVSQDKGKGKAPTWSSNLHNTSQKSIMVSPILGQRMKGLLFSYLPTLPKTEPSKSRKHKNEHVQPALPLPPQELLEKPRGPISTPSRVPSPQLPHPKDLVYLQPAPSKVSMIPRKANPQRLVELRPAPLPAPTEPPPPRPRRSSGASVSELVQNFEECVRKELETNKPSSRNRSANSKPRWKP